MDSSRGFGSTRRHCRPCGLRPLQTRFPSGSRALTLVNLRDDDTLAGSFYKRHAISPWWLLPQWPLTACKYEVSGSLSSPLRGAFHLSLTVLVHYRSHQIFSLGGWSPQLPTGFHVPRGTQDPNPSITPCFYGTLTRCGALFQAASNRWDRRSCWSYNPQQVETCWVWAPPGSLATTTGISVDFFSSGY